MKKIAQYLVAGALACFVLMPPAHAQQLLAHLVSLKTVIGQKYAVNLKVVEIDLDKANNDKFAFPDGFLKRDNSLYNEINPEFLQTIRRLEDAGLAKTCDVSPIIVRSSEVGHSRAKCNDSEYQFQVKSKVKDDDSVATNISLKVILMPGYVSAPKSNIIESRLGQPAALKLSEFAHLDKVYWVIANVDYSREDQTD